MQDSAYNYNGRPGQAHRIFTFSADTHTASGEQPWAKPPDANNIDHIVEFMGQQLGPADVLLCFDGRSITCRKAIAMVMESSRNACEIWLHYQPTERMGSGVAWASENREVGWISLPVPRTSIAAQQRDDDAAHWAASTHSSCYTNIAPASWESLTRISPDDKANIIDFEPSHTPATLCDTDRGMPLFWSERKSID